MGLKPLEFSDCLLDTPYFRDSIHDHEKELDQTNDAIKTLMKECRNLLTALKNLSHAQVSFSKTLESFELRYVGEVDVNDELEYEDAFPSFAVLVKRVEEERERMLHHADIQLIEPLEKFRKEQIGKAKDEKRKFDKLTDHICQLLENHSKLSPKKKDNALQELDAQLELELRNYQEQSLSYVSTLQEVNEKKKFELVEIMLAFMYGQSTFFHSGHEAFNDYRTYLTELQIKLQTTRDSFEVTKHEAEELKNKTKRKFHTGELQKGDIARQGYLFVSDRRKGVLGPTWVKHYCMYKKESKILTMIPYNQTNGKLNTTTDTLVVTSCVRKPTEGSDRRFLFDITGSERSQPLTLQSLTEEDRKQWLEVMEGREPIYMESSEFVSQNEGVTTMNEVGLEFVHKCLEAIEKRGLNDQGIYRIAGVSSKFNKLLNIGLDPKQLEKLDLISENTMWEVKTITSAMKQYFRSLTEPLFTFKHHNAFVQAIKLDTPDAKIERLKELLKLLPERNYVTLNRLMYHLKLVAECANKNLMHTSNLAVVLGPTLMRPKEETMAAIMNIKCQTLVIEAMIKDYDQLFAEGPPPSLMAKRQNSVPASPSTKYRAPNPPKPLVRPRSKIDSDPTSPRSLGDSSSISSNESVSPNNSLKRDASNKSLTERNMSNTNNDLKSRVRPPVPSTRKPGSIQSIKRWPVLHERPLNFIIFNEEDVFDIKDPRFAEVARPFTSPYQNTPVQEEELDTKSRRVSYARARDQPITSIEMGRNYPPISHRKPKLSDPSAPPIIPRRKEWKGRALYNCVAENEAELSFNAGAIITNVKSSTEGGWLIGMLNGKTGLVPENYLEKIE